MALNSVTQGTGSCILKLAMINFFNYIVNNNKYTEAYAVGTQSDLSMDMKVLTIFR